MKSKRETGQSIRDRCQPEILSLKGRTVAILGYGNQGRAHALNLRDSGIDVVVGAREGGKARQTALADGFSALPLREAAERAQVVMFLFPDTETPAVYQALLPVLSNRAIAGKAIGFAHGFAFHFKHIERIETCDYFLVGPKGAGAVLRARYQSGEGLPGVFAVAEPREESTVQLARAYAAAIGCATTFLKETSFREETETDLFGEQVVLCGGLVDLMQEAFEVLTEDGYDPEMAFLETCFEAQLILQLWMKFGPAGMTEKISPTAFYGGLTRGRRILGEGSKDRMREVLKEIQSGKFSDEWMRQAAAGSPELVKARAERRDHLLEKTYQSLRASLFPDAEPGDKPVDERGDK